MADKKSFEEQVRDELSGFEIAPEAFVWENVEGSLQKDKKRRWIVCFFLFAITGSAISYWMYHSFNAPGTTETKQAMATNAAPGSKKDLILITKPAENSKDNATAKAMVTVPVDAIAPLSKKLAQRSTNQPVYGSDVVNRDELSVAENEKQLIGEKDIKLQQVSGNSMENKNDSAAIVADVPLKAAEQQQTPVIPVVDTASSSQSDITDKKTVIAKARNPWKLYAVVDMGQSGLWYRSLYTSPSFSAAAPPSGIVTPSVYSDPGSRSAFSFGAGIDARKVLSKKRDIGISLSYQYYASKINVGRKVNNVVGFQNSFSNSFAITSSGYYLGSADETYINAYHLLETGVSFYRNYHLSHSFSLRWQLGVGGAWLFTSNALHYDQSQNILYKDNSLLLRFQVNLSTGLEAGIGKAQKIFVGPQFTYFPTTYSVQTSQYDYRHLVRIGLRTHILLSKNKKKK